MMYTAMLTRRRITLYYTAYLVEFYLSVILHLSLDIQVVSSIHVHRFRYTLFLSVPCVLRAPSI
jgi:hypothetical protein